MAMSVKWVVDPFGDGNGNGKKWVKCNQMGVFTLKGAATAMANLYVSLQLHMQNVVSPQPCVGKL